MIDIVFYRRYFRTPGIGDLFLGMGILLDVANAADETYSFPAELLLDLTHVTLGLPVDL